MKQRASFLYCCLIYTYFYIFFVSLSHFHSLLCVCVWVCVYECELLKLVWDSFCFCFIFHSITLFCIFVMKKKLNDFVFKSLLASFIRWINSKITKNTKMFFTPLFFLPWIISSFYISSQYFSLWADNKKCLVLWILV